MKSILQINIIAACQFSFFQLFWNTCPSFWGIIIEGTEAFHVFCLIIISLSRLKTVTHSFTFPAPTREIHLNMSPAVPNNEYIDGDSIKLFCHVEVSVGETELLMIMALSLMMRVVIMMIDMINMVMMMMR